MVGLPSLACLVSPLAQAAPMGIGEQREAAVALAKNGQLDRAIQQLTALQKAHPADPKINADLIVLLRRAGHNPAIQVLGKGLSVKQVAPYALMDWVGALRDQHDYVGALALLSPVYRSLGTRGALLYAALQAESGHADLAMKALPSPAEYDTLSADDLAQMSYVSRLSGQPQKARELSQLAVAKQPDLKAAQQEQELALAATGDVASLKSLHEHFPERMDITEKLLDRLRQDKPEDIPTLMASVKPESLSDRAVLTWASSLRDRKQFTEATQTLTARVARYESQKAAVPIKLRLLQSLVLLESGVPANRLPPLPSADTENLDAQDLTQLAYLYRQSGQPIVSLALSQRALTLPGNPRWALQEKAFALSDLNAPLLSQAILKQPETQAETVALQRVSGDTLIEQSQIALAEKSRQEKQGHYDRRFEALDPVLAQLEARQAAISDNPVQLKRWRFDSISLLRQRENYTEVIRRFEALPEPLADRPGYVRRAAADSYLALRQPEQAEALYAVLRQQTKQMDVALWTASYYALIESERYNQAAVVLKQMQDQTPTWMRLSPLGPWSANWSKLEVDQVAALDQAYRHRERKSQQLLTRMWQKAPGSTDTLNTLAQVTRWQGQPLYAQYLTEIAAGQQSTQPAMGKETRLNLAANARDLQRWTDWEQQISPLVQDFPTDQGVKNVWDDWQHRQDYSFEVGGEAGRSRTNSSSATTVTPSSVHGTADRRWDSRLLSPWFAQNWRWSLQHSYDWANFGLSDQDLTRVGAGLVWQSRRREALIELNQRELSGKDTGVRLGWSQWLDDHWFYQLGYNSWSADLPLRAYQAGMDAQTLTASVRWKGDESHSASATMSAMDLSDGNLRSSLGLGYQQRLWGSAHHVTEGGISAYRENNSQPGGVYFNPKSQDSIGLSLRHDWTTWRRYEDSLTQRFTASVARGSQSGYGSATGYDLGYQHEWKWDRWWQLNYGLGYGSHVYDGKREQRRSVTVGLSGAF